MHASSVRHEHLWISEMTESWNLDSGMLCQCQEMPGMMSDDAEGIDMTEACDIITTLIDW